MRLFLFVSNELGCQPLVVNMIDVKGLAYSYSPEKKIHFMDFAILKGAHWLLLGDSGSGKTTLLHLIGGLLKSQQGTVQVDETDITKLSESQLDHFRGKHLGFIFQKNHLISALTVEENLLMAPFLAKLKQDTSQVSEVLYQLGIADKKSSRIQELSQGQAQRVAIARAILNKPSIILADEPTSALDDKSCDKVIELLLGVASQSKSTLIIATHDQRLKGRVNKQLVLSQNL
jgi:ABC-type lipoprotein export system ATPase subunit